MALSKKLMNSMIAQTGLEPDEIQTWVDILNELDDDQKRELANWLQIRRVTDAAIKAQPFFR